MNDASLDVYDMPIGTKQAIAAQAGRLLLAVVRSHPDIWRNPFKRRAACEYIKCAVLGITSPFVAIYDRMSKDDDGNAVQTVNIRVPWISSKEIDTIDECIHLAIAELQFAQ